MKTRPLMMAAMAFGVICAVGNAAGDTPWNWGTETGEAAKAPQYAESKAICRRLGPVVIPEADRPTPTEAAGLKDCDAEKLYYGIGAAPEYAAARKCAILAYRLDDGDLDLTGSRLLMQIYANGKGVAVDRDLATRIACAEEDAPAESDGRVLHLQSMKKTDAFSWCDDITSGYAGGICAAHDARLADYNRDTKTAAVVAQFPAAARDLFPALQKAEIAFSKAQADGETDQTGTARADMVIAAGERQDQQFLIDLQRLASQKWPTASHAEAADADKALNRQYRKALAWAAGKDNFTTVKPDDIRAAQRAWLPYRDAWVRLGVAANVSADAVLARITRLRLAQLTALSEN